jgi:hypothetical protein
MARSKAASQQYSSMLLDLRCGDGLSKRDFDG